MKLIGKILAILPNYATQKFQVTFECDADEAEQIKEFFEDEASIEIKKCRKGRSAEANRCLWYCVNQIAMALSEDNFEVYKRLLKKHGLCTYALVKPNAVESFCKQFRTYEVLDEVDHNGQKAVQVLVFFGSSTYDSAEFAKLLDGIIEEMKDMITAGYKLDLPTPAEIRAAIERIERHEERKRHRIA